MSNKQATNATTALGSATEQGQVLDEMAAPGFLRRYRLPLFLAVVAVCLYAGSILYILYGRGQIA